MGTSLLPIKYQNVSVLPLDAWKIAAAVEFHSLLSTSKSDTGICDAANRSHVASKRWRTNASCRTVEPTLTRWVSPPLDASNQPRRSPEFLRKTLHATNQIYEIPADSPSSPPPPPPLPRARWIILQEKCPRWRTSVLSWIRLTFIKIEQCTRTRVARKWLSICFITATAKKAWGTRGMFCTRNTQKFLCYKRDLEGLVILISRYFSHLEKWEIRLYFSRILENS